MKIILTALLTCLLPAVLCWEFPGYPGVDCPTARQKMKGDPRNGWMLPKCNADGTYQDMQCFDVDVPDACMCTYKDGSPLTLPGFGLNISSCVCIVVGWDQYELGNLAPQRTCEPADHRDGTPANFQRTGPLSLPNCEHHEYVDEKSPDEYADSSFPDKDEESLPECYSNGYYKPLQCSKKTGECWCVTKYGNQVAPPSPDRKSCDDVTHLL